MNEKPTVTMDEKVADPVSHNAPVSHDIEHFAPVLSRWSRRDSKEPGHVDIRDVDEKEINEAEAVIHDEVEFT
jgi:hypothetical protein